LWCASAAKELNTRSWTVSITNGVATGAHSSSAGWTQARAGVNAWTATVEVYEDTTLAAAEPYTIGTAVTAQLWDGNRSFDGAAVIADVAYNCDIEGGELVGSSVTLQGDGAIVIAAATPS